MEIKKLLYKTIHRAKLSVDELADLLGVSSSTLYRCGNPNDESARFPLERVIPLMEATKDYSILHHLARRTGHVVFKIPRAAARSQEKLHEFQVAFTTCFSALLSFYKDEISKEDTIAKIDALISAAAAHRRDVEKSGQGKLEL